MKSTRYELGRLVGSGGSAVVHEAMATGRNGERSRVAVKRLLPHLAENRAAVVRLLDEAEMVRHVRSDHVVPLLDVVNHEGEVALVFAFAEGVFLDRLLDGTSSEPVPPAIAVAVARDVLTALAAAHEAEDGEGRPLRLIHRDVAPHNIVVTPEGIAKLTDFGIARARERATVTEADVVKGRAAYMAPEQLLGRPLTPQADLYACAVVLAEMLGGKPLFGGSPEAVAATRLRDFAAPEVTSAAAPPRLVAAVRSALSTSPELRPPHARAMADELTRHCPPAAPSEVAAWMRARERAGSKSQAPSRERSTLFDPAPPRRPSRGIPSISTAAGVAVFVIVGLTYLYLAADSQHRAVPLAASNDFATMPEHEVPFPQLRLVTLEAKARRLERAPKAQVHGREPVPAVSPSENAPQAASSPAFGDECEVPFDIDGAGHKVFRRDCL